MKIRALFELCGAVLFYRDFACAFRCFHNVDALLHRERACSCGAAHTLAREVVDRGGRGGAERAAVEREVSGGSDLRIDARVVERTGHAHLVAFVGLRELDVVVACGSDLVLDDILAVRTIGRGGVGACLLYTSPSPRD